MKNGFTHIRRDAKLDVIALFLLILALALPRLTALDRYVTVDEPTWLMNSANFYQALWTGNWKNTYQLEHPGVTITWAGTLGFLWDFPGYVKLVDGQLNKENKFREFLTSKGHAAIDLMVAGRTFTALGVILAMSAITSFSESVVVLVSTTMTPVVPTMTPSLEPAPPRAQ